MAAACERKQAGLPNRLLGHMLPVGHIKGACLNAPGSGWSNSFDL
jgi:hypothetical protein